MVEERGQVAGAADSNGACNTDSRTFGHRRSGSSVRLHRRGWLTGTAIVAAAAAALLVAVSPFGATARATARPGSTPAATARPSTAMHRVALKDTPAPARATVASTPVPVATTTTTTLPVVDPPIASWVGEVEASGIVPPPGWTWTVGTVPTSCGGAVAPGHGTGCTSWSSGVESTVFEGPVTLALVAHEIANAETEAYAIPTLLGEVQTAAGGSSWSATDAVATCLVAHFLGIQDQAAGSWQCPDPLATVVATHIHDVVVTNRIVATCGVASGEASTLTFDAGGGSLTVSGPSATTAPQTAAPGASVTASGIGTFTVDDVGGVPHLDGVCHA